MKKTLFLAKRPDLVLKLEKYDITLPQKKKGANVGCAKLWAQKGQPPYDKPEYQAMAKRLPTGWEELEEKEINTLLSQLEEAIAQREEADFNIINTGERSSIKKTVKITFLFIMMMATLIEEQGTGLLPKVDEEKKKRAKQFGFELILHMLQESGFVMIFFRKLCRGLSSDEKSQELIAKVLTHLALFLAILAASKGNEFRQHALLLSLKPTIQEGLDVAEKFLDDALAAGRLKNDIPEGLKLYVQQARIALEKEDFKIFDNLYLETLQLLNITPEQMDRDLEETRQLALRMQTAFTTKTEDETNKTTLSQTM